MTICPSYDRRANQVVLTKQGADVVGEIAPHMAAVLDRVFHDTLNPAEIETLIALLGRIEAAAHTPPGTARSRALDLVAGVRFEPATFGL